MDITFSLTFILLFTALLFLTHYLFDFFEFDAFIMRCYVLIDTLFLTEIIKALKDVDLINHFGADSFQLYFLLNKFATDIFKHQVKISVIK